MEDPGLLHHLGEEVICSQPFEGLSGLAVGLRVKGSPVQPSLTLRLSISPSHPYSSPATLPRRPIETP